MSKSSLDTTTQSLGSLLKSARDIMRKDKGLNGDLDRLPLLTWIMFLKFLDDLEIQREQEAKLAGKNSSRRLSRRIVGRAGRRKFKSTGKHTESKGTWSAIKPVYKLSEAVAKLQNLLYAS